MRLISWTVMVALVGACQPGMDSAQQYLIGEGRTPDATEFPNVCVMQVALPPTDGGTPRDPIFCTCTLVGERVVLTAARCVDETVEVDKLEDIDVRFGASFGNATPFAVEAVEIHRYYDDLVQNRHAIALILLETSPGIDPVILNEEPLGPDMEGQNLRLVGYGQLEPTGGTSGARYKLDVPIRTVDPAFLFAGTDDATSCDGDSGGPGFIDRNGEWVQAVITLRHGRNTCSPNIQRIRVDQHLTNFIYPYVDRFEGPCQVDDVCDPNVTCPRSPDPDCDDCLWGNVCEEDCPTRDFDCPLGRFVGESCGKSGDCEEGGRCVTAVDEPELSFCSRPCVPGAGGCPMGMVCTELSEGAGECTWLPPSPGAQGSTCQDSVQCLSGICEGNPKICVNTCNPSDPDACASQFGEYNCGPSSVQPGVNVCHGDDISGGGGFGLCAASGRAGLQWFGLLLAVFGLLMFRRRRRSR